MKKLILAVALLLAPLTIGAAYAYEDSAPPAPVWCNQYGCYPAGGSCNQYGCYPAGGSCNQYGCSPNGVCTQYGCP